MRFATVLAFATAASAVALPKSAVSPDGYKYEVVDEAHYVPETITLEDGTTSTVLVHPAFKFKRNEVEAPGSSANKVDKRLDWVGGQRPDTCGASSFVNKSSGGSPKTTDCVKIRDHYRTANGHFVVMSNFDIKPNGDWCRLVITGSCVFGIKSKNQWDPRVGSTDIADLTGDSINKFKTSGSPSRVGAEGNMGCQTDMFTGTASVDWAIFHN
ncbi:putative necrosis-inducing factor-domain-containing protein [Cladorrhinum sp. PSN332]|nr:putative necrosis-inducing factor-domain-containing protein [Cladorrhinum sp. PSN332]